MQAVSGQSYTRSPLEFAFKFKSDDLSYNRQGQLSPAQAETLRAWGGSLLRYAGLVIGAIVFAALLTLIFPVEGLRLVFSFAAFLGGLAIFILGGLWFTFIQDARQPRIETLEGQAALQIRYELDEQPTYELQIAQKKFKLTDDQHNALQNGLTYRFYLAHRSRTILSIEVV